ncbi:HEAT repeat domain-containing protein [Paeniglutamicibacter psychrophenolicus]|uniref:HEAT repeat domain-containing protein n=1 Tax=Paeniglutamicibacter psychrophenolicus TaxID=257454 RepID=UPI002783BBC8|nr:HEAT repeat domain-containing protein [Paeniglutamicibacter psychrophenolicus]MDQ0093071.1 hypothetical protein [Paeniglutamicibacter psychrophenolicus]
MAASLGLEDLTRSPAMVSAPQGGDSATTGTALDIRARIALGGFDARISASFAGVSRLLAQADHIENGRHRATVLAESFDLAEGLLLDTKDETQLDLAAVLFAYCEQILRGGTMALQGQLGEACDQALSAHEFANNIDSGVLADVRALMNAGTLQVDAWKSQIAGGDRFEPNPDFAGSLLVDGADGDWLIGETLIDCKVYGQLSTPKLRNFLLQLLGYVMLDLDDALKIRHVGLWLPRQQLTPTWRLEYLLAGDPEEVLPRLRDEFIKATNATQIALHIPATQRRKHQLLADNRHTRPGMLDALANSDDTDIRFRVGRNDMTPEATVRLLAKDRYARAREGVATNERVPADVLETLSRDSSVMVQQAAATNRGSSWQSATALGSGTRGSQPDALAMIDQPVTTGNARDFIGGAVEINQDRADWSLDTRWLTTFLSRALHADPAYQVGVQVPEASQMWSYISGRPFRFPHQLQGGFSDAVMADLFRGDRPAAVRRVVAGSLPVSDVEVRTRLLKDGDAEIRWSTLKRTLEQTDDSLSEFLGELAGSREVRLRFCKDEHNSAYWSPTPTELDQQVLRLLAGHPATPRQVLQGLIESKQPEVLLALARNTALESGDLEALIHKMIASRSLAARELFASSPHTPPEVLQALASVRIADVREILAGNMQAPLQMLAALSTDRSRAVRLAVLSNPATPADLATSIAQELLVDSVDQELLSILDALAYRMDVTLPTTLVEGALDELSRSRVREPDMRYEVGSDGRAGERTLKRLSKSADEGVRRVVAGNTRASATVLELLATDLDSDVRAAAAGNHATGLSALIELSQDYDVVVRLAVARNSNLSQEALRVLLTDDDPHVRQAASQNPSANAQDVHHGELERHEKPTRSRLARADLEEMAIATKAQTRIQVAYNEDAPPDILKFLGGERRSVKVRRAVAAHPNTPAEVLWSLATDKDLEVHQVIALNSNTPAELLVQLAGRSLDFALLVSLNPGVPDEVLDALAADGEALVRFVADITRTHRALVAGAEILQLSARTENAD